MIKRRDEDFSTVPEDMDYDGTEDLEREIRELNIYLKKYLKGVIELLYLRRECYRGYQLSFTDTRLTVNGSYYSSFLKYGSIASLVVIEARKRHRTANVVIHPYAKEKPHYAGEKAYHRCKISKEL